MLDTLDERGIQAVRAGADADQVATLTFYDPTGVLVTDTLGPARQAVIADGTLATVRPWAHTDYDQGAPATTPAGTNPATAGPWRLPTTVTTASVAGTVTTTGELPTTVPAADVVSRTLTEYGTTTEEWTLGLARRVITDVDASGGQSSGDIIAVTDYDSEGRVISTSQPGSTGTDAGTTLTRYYTAGAHPVDSACGGAPQWAGLACWTGPAATPGGPLGGSLPDARTTRYSRWLAPATVVETSGTVPSAVVRTRRVGYDAAGRPTSSSVTLTGLPGSLPAPGSVTDYDAQTGLVTRVRETTVDQGSGTVTPTGREVTQAYDSWGRQTTYTAGDGLTTTTAYDPATARLSEVTSEVGTAAAPVSRTTSYVWDGTDALGRVERRGLLTAVTTPGFGTVTGAYDTTATLIEERLPAGVTRRTTHDVAGEPTEVSYSGQVRTRDPDTGTLSTVADGPWVAWSQVNDVTGRVRAEWTPDGAGFDAPHTAGGESPLVGDAGGYARTYTYDRADRLTQVQDWSPTPGTTGTGGIALTPGTGTVTGPATPTLTCTVRAYAFDARGRRTELTITPGTPGSGTCPTSGAAGATTAAWAYDSADRLTTAPDTTPYTYDALGRTLTIPAADTPTATTPWTATAAPDPAAGPLTLTYDHTDTARQITQRLTTTDTGGNPAVRDETTTLTLDPTGRRETETTTHTPTTGGTPTPVSEIIRHYGDTTDNPTWTQTTTATNPEVWSTTADGLSGYTGTVTLTPATGARADATLHLATPQGHIAATVPLPTTGAADTLTGWTTYTEYGQPTARPTPTGTPTPGTRPGANAGGAGYGWHGTHERTTTTTGLHLLGARLHNPTTATFTTTDPIPDGNTTTYTHPQDPLNETDLTGMCNSGNWWCIKGIMQGRESLPPGFLTWARRTGAGTSTYLWRRPDGVLRRGIIDDRCTFPAPNRPLNFRIVSSCDTHDLGYALMRWFGHPLVKSSRYKLWIDRRFRNDMRAQCRTYGGGPLRQACYGVAQTYYGAVRRYNPDRRR